MIDHPTGAPAVGARPAMTQPSPTVAAWQVLVAVLLMLPAMAMLLLFYIVPAAWTVGASFRRVRLFGDTSSAVGFENYEAVFDERLAGQIGFALSLAAVPLFVVLLVAPLLAWAAHRGGTAARWVVRGLLTLPLAAYAPTAVAVASWVDAGQAGADDPGAVTRSLSWWSAFGLVTAIAVTLYLAALRRRDPDGRPWAALATAGGIAAAATVAVALQTFTFAHVGRGSATPLTAMFEVAFIRGEFGAGAAVATVLLVVLAALGIAVTVAAVRSGLRLEVDDRYRSADEPARNRAVGAAVAIVVVAGVLAVSLSGLSPWLRRLVGGQDPTLSAQSASEVVFDTWAPSLISALVGVTVAALAAFGISGLRPLGRHSEWVLLMFAPFLFVGTGPLSIPGYLTASELDVVDSSAGLAPPGWVVIPALFVLALLFRGQALRREALRQQGRPVSFARVVLPVLPMLAIAYVVTWVVRAQDLLWPSLVGFADHRTGPVLLTQAMQTFLETGRLPFDLVLPPAGLAVLVLLAVPAQLLYLDRVALRVGPPEHDRPPST